MSRSRGCSLCTNLSLVLCELMENSALPWMFVISSDVCFVSADMVGYGPSPWCPTPPVNPGCSPQCCIVAMGVTRRILMHYTATDCTMVPRTVNIRCYKCWVGVGLARNEQKTAAHLRCTCRLGDS